MKINTKNLPGKHQQENALLAKHAIDILNNFQTINATESNIKKGIKKTVWPGRFQTISHNPHIIFDVCHNDQGIKAFENDPAWHARKIKGDEMAIGKKELGLV